MFTLVEHTDVHRVEVSSLLSVTRARDWVYTVHVYTCTVYSGHGMRVYSYKCHRDHHLSHKSRKILIIHYWHMELLTRCSTCDHWLTGDMSTSSCQEMSQPCIVSMTRYITHRRPVTSPPRSCHQTMSLRYLFEILISDGMCGQEDLSPGMSWVLTNRTEYTKRSPELPLYNIHMVISAILRKWNWDSTSILPRSRTKIQLHWLICYESCDVGSSEATVIIIISLVSLCSYLARIVGCRKCLHTEASTKENDNQVKWVKKKVSYLINTRTHPLAPTDYKVQSIDVRGWVLQII